MKNMYKDKEFLSYLINDLETTNQLYLQIKYREFLESKSRQAFILRKVTKKKVVTCRACTMRGIVLPCCCECGGKGTHNKSYQCWEVSPYKVDIVKIDREPKNGQLRYWTGSSEFYYETVTPEYNKYAEDYPHGIHYVHFNYKEALAEAERLNEICRQRGEI